MNTLAWIIAYFLAMVSLANIFAVIYFWQGRDYGTMVFTLGSLPITVGFNVVIWKDIILK